LAYFSSGKVRIQRARRVWQSRLLQKRLCLVAILSCFRLVQAENLPDELGSPVNPVGFRYGPFDLHPRLWAGPTYDDNINFTPTNTESDVKWTVQPAFQLVAGDEDGLLNYRNAGYDVLKVSPGELIIRPVESWPNKVAVLDYGPRFQEYQKYSADDAVDELGTLNVLYPLSKVILGFRQDYDLEKSTIIEAAQRTQSEAITTAGSAAYSIGDKTSIDSNFQRYSIGYGSSDLRGYTEYRTEDWFNYEFEPDLHGSLGVFGGIDEVDQGQDQTFAQLRARMRYNYTEKLYFDASAGGEWRNYQNGHSDTIDPVFDISARYLLTVRTTLGLTGYRHQIASIYNGYYYTSTGALLTLRQEITDYCTINLSAGYYSLDYTPINAVGADHTDDFYTARIDVDFKIASHLFGEVFYQVLSRSSGFDGNIADNQVGARLTCKF
jgi:hypothetical protein